MMPLQPDPTLQGVLPSLRELLALRAQARRLDLAPRGRLLATRSGGHLSRFRGRGMEFDESRAYQPGDDPRQMDWRVTARSGRAHVKTFREERERPVWLLIDQGPGMRFGTRVAFKSMIAAQAAALLGWAALDRGDRVGGLVFDESGYLERRPAARTAGLLPLLERLASPVPAWPSGGTGRAVSQAAFGSIDAAARHLTRRVRSGSLVVIISDFLGVGHLDSGWIAELSTGNEVLLVCVRDPVEIEVPPPGRYPILDGARRLILDLSSRRARENYREVLRGRMASLQGLALRHQAHLLELRTDASLGPALALGLKGRGRASLPGPASPTPETSPRASESTHRSSGGRADHRLTGP